MRTTMRLGLIWAGMGLLVACGAVAHAAGGRSLTTSDVVVIRVTNQPDMDTTTRVELDGTINFPYVGRIRAAGLNEDQLAREIEHRLAARQIVTDPHVLIEVTGFGTQASVQGQVGAPGTYTIDRTTTLSQLLARAGGVRESGGPIVLRRRGPRGTISLKYNTRDLLTGKVNGDRIYIQNNDEVYVDLVPFYYVYGFVGRTGEFPLVRPLTVQQAISIAGGLGPLGAESRIRIKRKQANGQTEEMPASLDDQVEPDDTIVVNERIF